MLIRESLASVRGIPRGAWERTTVQDRLLILVVFALGGAVTSVLGLAIFGPPIVDFLGANIPSSASSWPSRSFC